MRERQGGYNPEQNKEAKNTLEHLRELLSKEPSSNHFSEIIALVDSEDDTDKQQIMLEYAEQHLHDWPDDVREFPIDMVSDIYDQNRQPEEIQFAFTLAKK